MGPVQAVTTLLLVFCSVFTFGQTDSTSSTVPVATQAVLKASRSETQRHVIKSVMLIVCPKDMIKGTGFVLAPGDIVTSNSHVVGSCTAQDLKATSSLGATITFSNAVQDKKRDLALLCPTQPLANGLNLGGDVEPALETEVETWGYPLKYEQAAPILSRGYVAGYTTEQGKPAGAKHIIINGALNPGNSGGPLIDRATGKVIGIVVAKWTLWSPNIETAIKGFQHPSGMAIGGNFSWTDAKGQLHGISDEEMIGLVLQEFYESSQVMLGEAISVSELNQFLKEKREVLACQPRTATTEK